MNLIIFGASGKTGHELVKQSLEQGHVVTAYVRHPKKLMITNANLKVIQGDIIHYGMVEQAIKGQDAVLSVLGASSPFKYDPIVVEGVGNIIKAMEANNVLRFIYMSFVGVKDSRSTAGFVIKYIAPKLLSTEIKGHEAREKMIKASPLEWTIVRPATLTNGVRTAKYRSGEDIIATGFTATISRADVAHFMLSQLTDKRSIRKTPKVMY